MRQIKLVSLNFKDNKPVEIDIFSFGRHTVSYKFTVSYKITLSYKFTVSYKL